MSAVSSRGMIAPNRNAPKIWWMPIRSVMYADRNRPTRTTASNSGERPSRRYQTPSRVSCGLTTRIMSAANATASRMIRGKSRALLASTTATAIASSDQASTSSTAAQARASAPIDVRYMPRSLRMRARTGNAVTDIDAPRNTAKGR